MLQSIQKDLAIKGFDLCHPIHTKWYNDMIRNEGLVDNGTLKLLPELSATQYYDTVYNAILVGNTKRVWPVFLIWLAQQKQGIPSPFDTFVELSIADVLHQHFHANPLELISYEIFWSNGKRQRVERCTNPIDSLDGSSATKDHHCFDNNDNSFLVSMQRVAKTTGQYWLDEEATKLCVHPEYGTWTAFRAVVVFETSRNENPVIPLIPQPCPCPVSSDEIMKAKIIFEHALKLDDKGYGATLEKSWSELCEFLHHTACSGAEWDKVPATMKSWIQLRDVISVGRDNWKYDDNQLLYHYTKDPEILVGELKRRRLNE